MPRAEIPVGKPAVLVRRHHFAIGSPDLRPFDTGIVRTSDSVTILVEPDASDRRTRRHLVAPTEANSGPALHRLNGAGFGGGDGGVPEDLRGGRHNGGRVANPAHFSRSQRAGHEERELLSGRRHRIGSAQAAAGESGACRQLVLDAKVADREGAGVGHGQGKRSGLAESHLEHVGGLDQGKRA